MLDYCFHHWPDRNQAPRHVSTLSGSVSQELTVNIYNTKDEAVPCTVRTAVSVGFVHFVHSQGKIGHLVNIWD